MLSLTDWLALAVSVDIQNPLPTNYMHNFQQEIRLRKLTIASVVKASRLSPNMIRVTLHSEEIKAFSSDCAGGHLKLVIPPSKSDIRQFEKFLASFNGRKQIRTYTIRNLDLASAEIDVDFVVHGDTGPASAWALTASANDYIGISPPGAPKLKNAACEKYLIAVDMSAFPAAAAAVEKLPSNAQGNFFTEILSPADVQVINAPIGLCMHWVVKELDNEGDSLTSAVKRVALVGDESVFVAGEYSAVSKLKAYFRTEKKYPKEQLYISSYWKQGLIEAQHKRVKTLID